MAKHKKLFCLKKATCDRKIGYPTYHQALRMRTLMGDFTLTIYRCPVCCKFHLGHHYGDKMINLLHDINSAKETNNQNVS